MRHSKKSRRGRARGPSEDALFERALMGESSDGRKFDPRGDRKTLQLCRQVQRALAMAVAGECADEVLRDVYVEAVEPLGGAGQLLVRVIAPRGVAPVEVMARLGAATPRLRALVAAEICRKRVPMLSFVVVPDVIALAPGMQRPEETGAFESCATPRHSNASVTSDAPPRIDSSNDGIRGGAGSGPLASSGPGSPALPRRGGEGEVRGKPRARHRDASGEPHAGEGEVSDEQ